VKIPYAWVQEFVALRLTAEQAADRLTNAGIEVASVTPLVPDLKGVVVGEIETIERELEGSPGHRLLLCRVSTGRERYSVVCGAPNTKVGARAAFAPPGAVLPGGRRIATAEIHGTESQGMLCDERELGLGEDREAGLLLLDGAAAAPAALDERLSRGRLEDPQVLARGRLRHTDRPRGRRDARLVGERDQQAHAGGVPEGSEHASFNGGADG